MIWKILVGIFLVLAFLMFLRLSSLKINGKRILSLPLRVLVALVFPVIFVLVFIFSSMVLLFVLGILFLIFMISLVVFFIRKFSRRKEYEDVIVIKRKK